MFRLDKKAEAIDIAAKYGYKLPEVVKVVNTLKDFYLEANEIFAILEDLGDLINGLEEVDKLAEKMGIEIKSSNGLYKRVVKYLEELKGFKEEAIYELYVEHYNVINALYKAKIFDQLHAEYIRNVRSVYIYVSSRKTEEILMEGGLNV